MKKYRVHVIEHQWGGFDADFYTYARADSAEEALAKVAAVCPAWDPQSAVSVD